MEAAQKSATYPKHHLDVLRDDRRKIVKAASLAKKRIGLHPQRRRGPAGKEAAAGQSSPKQTEVKP